MEVELIVLFLAFIIVVLFRVWQSHVHAVVTTSNSRVELEYGILRYINLCTCRAWCHLDDVTDDGRQVTARLCANLEVFSGTCTEVRKITWAHNRRYEWREIGRIYSKADIDYIIYVRPNRKLQVFELKIRQDFGVRMTMHCIEVRKKRSIANEK